MNTTGTSTGFGENASFPLMMVSLALSLVGQAFYFNQKEPRIWNTVSPKVIKASGNVWREVFGKEVEVEAQAESIKKKRDSGLVKTYTWAEVNKHNTKEDLWLVIDGGAYDVTSFVDRHPGGYRPLLHMAGRDATDVMAEYHPANVYEKMLPKFFKGDVVDYQVSDLLADYRAIRQGLLSRGLFETSKGYYYAKYVWLASIFIPSICGVVYSSSSTVHMLCALGLALFWQQLAFVGHDLGHSSVSHCRTTDYYWGSMFGNVLGGISLYWWKLSHNTHHVTCNSVEHDPDIQHLPVFAITNKLFGRFYSSFHHRYFETDAIARFLVSYQHYLFYPIMGLARFNLYIQGWILLFTPNEPVPFRNMQFVTMAIFPMWIGYLLSFLPSWEERIAFLLLSHFFAGVLHVQITISHFSMDTFHGHHTEDWIRHQMATTMNVSCPTWMDWFHGGLQFQLEHHLFPRLPRHNLRVARGQVLLLAEKYHLNYVEDDFINANIRTLTIMKKTALEARKLKKGNAGFYESALFDGLNAQG